MKTSTTLWRTFALCVVLAGAAGTAHAQRTVTLRLNTATLPDTTTASTAIQVRGCLQGCAGDQSALPGGQVIAWNDNTTLTPTNVGGDYWDISFDIETDDTLNFKFFSAQAEATGIGGWEDGSNHFIGAGTNDTTLVLHYYEKGDDKAYDWRPWAQKEDSVAVWFRVFMNTEGAPEAYDPSIDTLRITVRGDNLDAQGPLDWSANTKVVLQQESTNQNHPGYHLFSGVGYYPESLVGRAQSFKYYIDGLGLGDGDAYEGQGDNRTFVVPASDTTLQWVFFENTPPLTGEDRVTANITFRVNIEPLEAAGIFDAARGDEIQVRGGFNGWDNSDPDDSELRSSAINPSLHLNEIPVRAFLDDNINYKYFVQQGTGGPLLAGVDYGYEEPLDYGGGNRVLSFDGNAQDLGVGFFNNIRPGNVIPAGTEVVVNFQVNMAPAVGFTEKPAFNPATDQVRVAFQDLIWRATQAEAKEGDLEDDDIVYAVLEDSDGDLVYTGTYTVEGPTYNALGFAYEWGTETDGFEPEGAGGFDAGRRRYQYILPNSDGSFPGTYTVPLVNVQENVPLPFECNPTLSEEQLAALPEDVLALCYEAGTQPTAVEDIGGSIPTAFTVEGNFPNPFSGKTAFRYTLPQAQHVTVRVYDVTGRVVATLVDGVQAASTYEVTFDGEGLSSGMYFYRVQTDQAAKTGQMMLVR